MEQTLQALGGILLKAIPTVILLLILHVYLKAVLFGPMEKMLKQRHDLTEGARKAADASLAAAEQKANDYDAKLRDARAAVYKDQEEIRRKWLEQQASEIDQARQRHDATVRAAKESIATEASAARQTLEQASAGLADEIATALLARKA